MYINLAEIAKQTTVIPGINSDETFINLPTWQQIMDFHPLLDPTMKGIMSAFNTHLPKNIAACYHAHAVMHKRNSIHEGRHRIEIEYGVEQPEDKFPLKTSSLTAYGISSLKSFASPKDDLSFAIICDTTFCFENDVGDESFATNKLIFREDTNPDAQSLLIWREFQ